MSQDDAVDNRRRATNGIRVAYLVVYIALLVVGGFVHLSLWLGALIGVAVTIPIAVVDVLVTRRDRAVNGRRERSAKS